jgi:hypothetical protein
MDKKVKIEVHAPHYTKDCDTFVVVRVEGALSPRVGDRIEESELSKLGMDRNTTVTQTGVWGAPRRI